MDRYNDFARKIMKNLREIKYMFKFLLMLYQSNTFLEIKQIKDMLDIQADKKIECLAN